MKLIQVVKEAFDSLLSNKLRSVLTILGIIIGVGAVIAMIALGDGAEAQITGEIQGFGSDLIFVFAGSDNEDVRNVKPLTLSDAADIADPFNAPSVMGVAPVVQQGNVEISSSGESRVTTVTGVTEVYDDVRLIDLFDGEFIDETMVNGRSSVVVLGYGLAEDLFGSASGLFGETVRINGQQFRVIGVLEEVEGQDMQGENDLAIVPLTTAHARFVNRGTADTVDTIYVSAFNSDVVKDATEEIAVVLRENHKTEVGLDDFSIVSQDDILGIASSVTAIFTVFLGGIAAISLLVGGIGIMNIMLVSVIERTREIGLRKALGARKNDIVLQFLTESVVLSLLGGIFGILLGFGLSAGVAAIASSAGTPFAPVVSLNAVLLATLASSAIGVLAGIYPANRAANLVPVEALRSE